MKQSDANKCTNLHGPQRNILLLQPITSRRVCYVIHCVTRAKAKIICICPAHFLAGRFAEAQQVFAVAILLGYRHLRRSICRDKSFLSRELSMKFGTAAAQT